ncbi:hypothetical protein DPMN_163563 [Dreissena polymorpha]|uniref:Secreted protein n=1 Tax=Dreissena polymorpha TaxID=45954 RepID=A0A9D4EU65_DREPO|nr:hypothetical protein DPMN_163563 [Dreissena polymorpha]
MPMTLVTALSLIPTFFFLAHDTSDSAPSHTNLLLPCPRHQLHHSPLIPTIFSMPMTLVTALSFHTNLLPCP